MLPLNHLYLKRFLIRKYKNQFTIMFKFFLDLVNIVFQIVRTSS